jgi:hypothetical protein
MRPAGFDPRRSPERRAAAGGRRDSTRADRPSGEPRGVSPSWTRSAMTAPDDRERRLPHHPPPIVAATDRRGGGVLRHGTSFLVSDELGDVRPGKRGLGLYHGDTRLLSCLQLRIDGRSPRLLAAGEAAATSDTILLTADGRRGGAHGAGGPAAPLPPPWASSAGGASRRA